MTDPDPDEELEKAIEERKMKGEEIRDEVIGDLESVVVGAISYMYVDEDGETVSSTARFATDYDEPVGEQMSNELKVDAGLKKLQAESPMTKLMEMEGLGPSGDPFDGGKPGPDDIVGVMAIDGDEIGEALMKSLVQAHLGMAEPEGDSGDEDGSSDPSYH